MISTITHASLLLLKKSEVNVNTPLTPAYLYKAAGVILEH